ncbi:CU044_5270 family protein [Streptomyces buecherae]|uniref:CU044_5270 family protein n=1 Tax=Streptomyces buecherae TaxID=2763006 RepID=UPI00365F7177
MTDLPSAPERDLPPGRHHLLREHLVHEIRRAAADRPAAATPRLTRRWPRPAFAGLALASTLALVVLATMSLPGGGEDGTSAGRGGAASYAFAPHAGADERDGAARVLEHAAAFAERERVRAKGPVRDDQYVYVDGMVAVADVGQEPIRIPEPHRRAVWAPVDGTGERTVAEGGEWSYGPRAGISDGPGSSVYRYLRSLPTEPDALYAWLREAARTRDGDTWDGDARDGEDEAQQMFEIVAHTISDAAMPPGLSAALFRAAARIPGTVVVEDAVDAAGRRGVAVARTGAGGDDREELIFDRVTGQYLGQRTVWLKDSGPIEAGMVSRSEAVFHTAIVDRLGQYPVGRPRVTPR